MITRRDFMRSGVVAAGTAAITAPVLAKSVFAASADATQNDRVLVVVQCAGGNDGLNTVVPFADPAYHGARQSLALQQSTLLPLTATAALHPALKNVKRLYDSGQVAIVQGVGYPQPTYSHFEGMYVWQHADPERRQDDGWLGSLLATGIDSAGHPLASCAAGETSTPPELSATSVDVSVIGSADSYRLRGDTADVAAAPGLYKETPGPYGVLLDRALSTAQSGIAAVASAQSTYKPAVAYPATGSGSFAASLQLIASLIVTQPGVKVCHVTLGGFDTHQDEAARQAALLGELDAALAAFLADLAAHGQQQRVVVMTWSEFGRRIAENGSGGTDHGAAAPLFVLGASVRGGLHGEPPSLTSTIDSGNLKYTVDFRSVYPTIFRDWLQADAQRVLGGSFPEVPLLRV
jgi:uncharacterized protein (DUF1501 family)